MVRGLEPSAPPAPMPWSDKGRGTPDHRLGGAQVGERVSREGTEAPPPPHVRPCAPLPAGCR